MEVVELLSDSDSSAEDTILYANSNKKLQDSLNNQNENENVDKTYVFDAELENLLNKYAKNKGKVANKSEDSSQSDSSSIKTTKSNESKFSASPSTSHDKPKRQKLSSSSKEEKLNEKALKQAEKQKQKALKKEEAEREKQLKKALKEANKNIKPDECIKYITVNIDPEIINSNCGNIILTALSNANIKYKVESQLVENSITWIRQVTQHLIDENGKLTPSTETITTDEVLLLMDYKKIIELVHSKSLIQHVKSLQLFFHNKKLFFGLYGLSNYFKYQKSKKRQEVQGNRNKKTKEDKLYENIPTITKKCLEFALTELQLLCGCCYRLLDVPEDFGALVNQLTKAIAQKPYKLEKQEKYQEAAWYMQGDKKDSVKVDQQGNGLKRLWQQQLISFPLASLETAAAITTKYPTPHDLLETYNNCSKTEGEQLLQDIPIRRAAGPLTAVRKIGPELSKKIYIFFTSINGKDLL